MSDRLDSMLTARQIERVAVNLEHAHAVIDTAEQHLRTAAILADTEDTAMAFTAAYDAARKALAAVLSSEGLRVRPVGGAQRNTGLAAAILLRDDALAEFEWMRQVRNATEYPDEGKRSATRADGQEALEAATRIVEVCAQFVQDQRP